MKRIPTRAKIYLAFGILWICTASAFAAIWHFEEMFGYPLTFRGGGHVDPTQAHVGILIMFAFGVYCLVRSFWAYRRNKV